MDNGNTAAQAVSEPSQLEIELAEVKLRSLTMKRWLRTDEVALYLGTTIPSIKKLVLRKKLAPRKRFGRLYFDRNAIDEVFENSVSSAPHSIKRNQRWR
jgi:hypothetical protein